jgi:ABC-2 type transport system ATP-binding protein
MDAVGFDYGRTHVLRDLNWVLGPGVTGVLGPNGAGKTTLLRLLVGMARPKRGAIRISGDNGRRVGYLPQRFSLAGEMRLQDTVAYAAWIQGVARSKCAEHAADALAAVELADRMRQRCRTLSGGQRQRLGIAASIVHRPELLVLDEPTVGLDPEQRIRVRQIIADIGRDRMVLLSTHLAEDITHLCSRVGVLTGGRIVFDGTPDDLVDGRVKSEGTLGSDFEHAYVAIIDRHSGK